MAEYLRPPIVAGKPLVPPRKRTRIKASHLNPHIALNFIDFDCWNGIWGLSCAIFSLESRAMKFIFWSNSIKCNAQTRYQHFQSVLTTGDSTGIVPNPGRFSLHGQFRAEMYKYWGMSRIWTMICSTTSSQEILARPWTSRSDEDAPFYDCHRGDTPRRCFETAAQIGWCCASGARVQDYKEDDSGAEIVIKGETWRGSGWYRRGRREKSSASSGYRIRR